MSSLRRTATMILMIGSSVCALPCLAKTSKSLAPETLVSSAQDSHAIDELLSTYTRAVSNKNEKLFETILLNKQIPFSYVSGKDNPLANNGIANYEAFRKGVFEGPPFTQAFKNVDIKQDGNLASVRLVFINKDATSSTWGWKTLQLLKVNGTWKIASEFYTVH